MNSCPRCGDRSFEILNTHSHCYSCNFTPEIYAADFHQSDGDDLPIPKWVMEFLSSVDSSTAENRRSKKQVRK